MEIHEDYGLAEMIASQEALSTAGLLAVVAQEQSAQVNDRALDLVAIAAREAVSAGDREEECVGEFFLGAGLRLQLPGHRHCGG